MTAVVAFTFGSLGDIISLLQIANTVRKALCDTKGASAEYYDLLAELDSLVYTIASVQRTLSVHGPNCLSQSVDNGLRHAVHVCLRLLAQANERAAAFRSSTTGNLWRRVGWILVRKDEVVALRLRLSEQIKAMNTLLTLAQGDRLDRVAHKVDRIAHGMDRTAQQVDRARDQLDSVQVTAREQHALVVEIHRCVKNLPQRLGYFWEGDPGSDSLPISFRYTDGHIIPLPWELCATKKLFRDFLTFYTRDRREAEDVRFGAYALTLSDDEVMEDENDKIEDEKDFKDRTVRVAVSQPDYWYVKPGSTFNFRLLDRNMCALKIMENIPLVRLSWPPYLEETLIKRPGCCSRHIEMGMRVEWESWENFESLDEEEQEEES